MTPILLLLLFPLLVVVGSKIWNSENFSWSEAGVQTVLTILLIVGGYHGGKALEMSSVEFWTGQVTGKTHEDGHYQTSYSCNCRTTGTGNNKTETCDTCYTDHYTRVWYLNTTLGKITTSDIDTESRSRRNNFASDSHWNEAYEGEACSITNTYTNYVAAAESSLHHRSGAKEKWAGKLPAYPQLHGIYHLNRVHDLGAGIPNLDKWRKRLDDFMRTLGGAKQINLMVYFVPTTDTTFKHALEAHWNGANKNDTIVIVGVDKGTKDITWVDAITWAKSDIYKSTIIDAFMDHKTITDGSWEPMLAMLNETTLKLYERRPMAEFEHLAKEIKPPTWVMVILIIIAIPGSLVLAYVFHRIDLDAMISRSGRGGSFRRSSGIRIRRRRF